ncbi:hypothetical protein [Aureispira anguillae]|uniref:Uncharacterized protein n=1 Tax=Aureispira anguillae TaxID=2864201 RepID=A0A916DSF7_9BACT|nr:hypothetical protein [Aureispira anguillae]BDS11155.1 hypothetical protein AsAng_0018660 [Aureispira anguillae]
MKEGKQLMHQATVNKKQIQKILAHCQDKQIDLRTLLSPMEFKQFREDVAYLKAYFPLLKVEFLMNSNTEEEEKNPEALGKGAFIRAALKLLKELSQAGDPFHILEGAVNNNAYTIDTEKLIINLSSIKPQTPLGNKFMELLQKNATKCITIDKVKKVLIAILKKLNDRAYLAKHYDAHKVTYLTKEEMTDELEGSEIFELDLKVDFTAFEKSIATCIATAINDPAYEPNIEKIKGAARERKEEEEALANKLNNFQQSYEAWVKEQKKICTTIISADTKTDSSILMPKTKFMAMLLKESKVWEQAQPELTQELLRHIVNKLSKEEMSIKEFVNAMSAAITEIQTPLPIIASNWFKRPKLPEYYSLKTAIIANNSGYGEYDLMEEYLVWFREVGAAVDSLKLGSNQQFIVAKIFEKTKKLFEGKQELDFFYTPFETKLKGTLDKNSGSYCSLKQLSYAWTESLYDVIINSGQLRDSLHHLTDQEQGAKIEALSDTLLGVASVERIQRVFLACKRPMVKTEALAKGELLSSLGWFNDGTEFSLGLSTTVERVEGIPFINPVEASIAIGQNGKLGYVFELSDFSMQSPIINGKEGVTVYFEYKIGYTKDRGSLTVGNEQGTEKGKEEDSYQEETIVNMNNWNTSTEGDVDIKSGGLLKLLVDAGGQVSGSIGGGQEWGTEKTSGSTVVLSSTKSLTSSESRTKEDGIETGFFWIEGNVYSFDLDNSGGTLNVQITQIASPKTRGLLTISVPQRPSTKTLRWAK